jgi:glyoxylase-like metal-dependent hydrolase (beta-lactamase superfamily II)
MKRALTALTALVLSSTAFAAPLTMKTYNPQENAIFPVSSTLVYGPSEAVLFDAQFSVKDGEKLVEMVRNSGKKLTRIVITSGDPDFYFGLEPLVNAFPNVEIVATPAVVAHIKATRDAKLAYWGPQLKEAAPQHLYTPKALSTLRFAIDGETVEIKRPESYAAYVWIPANRAILGGTGVASGIHLWTADTQTATLRNEWRSVLKEMQQQQPTTVIPGHYLGALPSGAQAIDFTRDYLQKFEQALASQKKASGVITQMKAAYPTLAEESSLEMSAKVNTGEMAWK